METSAEIDEPVVRPLPKEQIIKEREAALPSEPMDAAKNDVIGSESFNSMSSKLEKAMKEVMAASNNPHPEKSTAPVDKEQTDSSKAKPEAAKADSKADENKTTPEDAVENKTITSAKAADWKVLKEKLKAHEATANEFKQKYELTTKEYEEFKKKAVDSSQFEPVVKERDEIKSKAEKLETQLKTVALERSEAFSSFYQKKFDESLSTAKEAVGDEYKDRIEQLMQLPPSPWRKERINEIREELIGSDQGQLDIAISSYDKARKEREEQLKDSKTNYEKMQQAEKDRAAMEAKVNAQRTEAAMNGVLAFAKDKFDAFKTNDDEEHNASVAESEKFVRSFFERKLPDDTIALLPVLAREATRLQKKVIPDMEKKIKELETALKQYQGSNPSPSGSKAPSNANAPKKGFIETFNEQWPAGAR